MKVVICGAGIAGLATAIRLSAFGADVVVLERSQDPRPQGYLIDIFGPGYDAVEAMGLLPALQRIGYHIEGLNLVDERGRGRVYLSNKFVAQATGGRQLSVMRPDLEMVLQNNLPPEVDLRRGSTVLDVSECDTHVAVTLNDGKQLDADLLIGADGIHSTVRERVFGAESQFLRYLGLHAAAFVVDAPQIANLLQGKAVLTDTIGREMGFYTLRDGRVAVFAVHRNPDQTMPVDSRVAIRDACGGLRWLVPQALELCPASEQIYYDQVAQIDMPRWSKGRIVLVGDACFAVSVMAGQGASLGIAGACVLAEQLRTEPSLELALTGYEKLFRPVINGTQKRGRGAIRWLVPSSAGELRVRRTVLRLARLPGLNRYAGAALVDKSAHWTAVKNTGAFRPTPPVANQPTWPAQ